MASIISRNGKYAVIHYEGDDRHQVMKSGLTKAQAEKLKAKKDAEEKRWREQKKAQQKLAAAEALQFDTPQEAPFSNVTLAEFMEEFITQYGSKHWGAAYYASAKALMNNYVYPYFGQHKITYITTKMIDDFYTLLVTKVELVGKGKGKRRTGKEKKYVTPSLVSDIHKILRTAFNQARRWRYIKQNPFLDADLPEYKEKERPAFSPEEFEKILEYTDDPGDYQRFTLHLALCIQYYCTTRGGEIGALQWEDYDPEKRTLHIYKALARIDKANLDLPKLKVYYTFPVLNPYNRTKVVLKAPKTEATARYCVLNHLMMDKLDWMKSLQEKMVEEVFGTDYQDNRLIVCQPNGRPMMPEQLNTKFKEVIVEMRESGYQFTSVAEDRLDDVVFHSVRAASATKKMQVSKGNIKAVMRAGGWAEPDMVIRYAKTYDQDQALIAEQMEKDAHKEGNTGASQETEELLQKILEHPEVLSQLIQALKP